jgi:hypothetical protein
MTVMPTRMYPNGPIRMFSDQRFLGGVPYSGGTFKGFAGGFVCACCRLEVHRVLFEHNDWHCRGCVTAWKRADAQAKEQARA